MLKLERDIRPTGIAIIEGRKVFRVIVALSLIILAPLPFLSCSDKPPSNTPSSNRSQQTNTASSTKPATGAESQSAKLIAHEIVSSYPHDPQAFLQGLVYYDNGFYESTGQYGESTLRKVELQTGRVIKKLDLADDVFGEGLAMVGDKLYQLTWQNKKGFVYDRETFQLIQEFRYEMEGWGLTYDGASLILSDGSSELTYFDAQSIRPTKKLAVTINGRPVSQINELEFIEGEIWANVWHEDVILRIDPSSGRVTSYLNLKDLRPRETLADDEAVLNGIAYDAAQKRIFVSGKRWPRVFEIRIK